MFFDFDCIDVLVSGKVVGFFVDFLSVPFLFYLLFREQKLDFGFMLGFLWLQVQHLQKVLAKKRDPVTHVCFIDELAKVRI